MSEVQQCCSQVDEIDKFPPPLLPPPPPPPAPPPPVPAPQRKATELNKNCERSHDKTRKTIKPKHSLGAERKSISELERTIQTIK